jgi:predicted kinase
LPLLTAPVDRMTQTPATLYVVCGKIAAGKTTLARKLAAAHGAVLICEDEWLVRLEAEISSFDDFVVHARRLQAALGPHVVELLRLGVSVVLDVPGNTVKARQWIRSLFDAAPARHELHWIDAPDDVCRARLRARNETKPEGLYFGHVPEAIFDPVNRGITPPAQSEGFNVIWHRTPRG